LDYESAEETVTSRVAILVWSLVRLDKAFACIDQTRIPFYAVV